MGQHLNWFRDTLAIHSPYFLSLLQSLSLSLRGSAYWYYWTSPIEDTFDRTSTLDPSQIAFLSAWPLTKLSGEHVEPKRPVPEPDNCWFISTIWRKTEKNVHKCIPWLHNGSAWSLEDGDRAQPTVEFWEKSRNGYNRVLTQPIPRGQQTR